MVTLSSIIVFSISWFVLVVTIVYAEAVIANKIDQDGYGRFLMAHPKEHRDLLFPKRIRICHFDERTSRRNLHGYRPRFLTIARNDKRRILSSPKEQRGRCSTKELRFVISTSVLRGEIFNIVGPDFLLSLKMKDHSQAGHSPSGEMTGDVCPGWEPQ